MTNEKRFVVLTVQTAAVRAEEQAAQSPEAERDSAREPAQERVQRRVR
jgi:hypothetical protein